MIKQVKIDSGWIRGVTSSDMNVTMFRGIPYAQPPVGALRWRAPQPVVPWQGVRDCLEAPAVPMRNQGHQDERDWGYNELVSQEDCLYLNVWTPAKTAEEKLPVMIWIYGGGNVAGDSYQPVFEGTKFASRGVVFVSMNYRLDIFGMFAHPEITAQHQADGCTNFLLLDQAAAFAWVQRNIAAFGGDPTNVTIFGHSAGGFDTVSHILSPKTEGLFQKAIVMSGGGIPDAAPVLDTTLEQMEPFGLRFQEFCGCKNLDELKKLDGPTILQKSREFCMTQDPIHPAPAFRGRKATFRWNTCSDHDFVIEPTGVSLVNRRQKNIPIMIGHADMDFAIIPTAATLAEFEENARARFGADADEYLKAVDFACGDLEQIIKNGTYANQCLLAENWCEWADLCGGFTQMFAYNMDHPRPEDPMGTSHGVDVDYAFDNLHYMRKAHLGKDYDVSRQTQLYFINFAKNGDPNGNDIDGTPLPTWTPYTAENPTEMCFLNGAHMQAEQPKVLKFLVKRCLDFHKKNTKE